jgi:xylulokinase
VSLFVGIDAGTTALKAAVFDERGNCLAVAREEYTLETPAADRAELDPKVYWQALVQATRRILTEPGVDAAWVAAMAVSSQGETVIATDAGGRPLAPALVWLDNRAQAEADQLADRFAPGDVYATTGIPAINPTWTASKLAWWRSHEPALYGAAARFVLVEAYLLHALTGRFVSDGSAQCTTLLYDIRSHGWWAPMLAELELSADRLPDLEPAGSIVGSLTRSAADQLGLAAGVRVVAGGMDQCVGAVGVGNVSGELVSESTGGALTLQATVARPDGDASARTPVYVHSVTGQYLYCPVCPTGGLSLTWFRDQFGAPEVAEAARRGVDAYDLLTQLAAGAPAGADGLIMLPHLMGAFSPEYEPRARGVFYGFTLAHGRGHFVRAILEAVAFMLRRNIELLAGAGAAASEIRSHGGGSRSQLWCQIKADVTGLPVVTLAGEDAAVRGDAMLAGLAVGEFGDLDEACAAMVREVHRYVPDARTRATYETAYTTYVDLFDALEPLFSKSQ